MAEYTDYDKITDTLMFLSNEITLQFVVSFSHKDKSGNRSFYHNEFQTISKYRGTDASLSIKRTMNFFYVINNVNNFGDGVMLRVADVELLTMLIEKNILPWYFDPKKRIFSIIKDEKKLVITGRYEIATYSLSEYRALMFEPIVLTYDGPIYKEGIRIYLNSQSQYADMDIDKFMGFYHILKTTDMYAVAATLCNYAKLQPYGINVRSYTGGLGSGGDFIYDNQPSNQKPSNGTKNDFLGNAKRKER